MLTTSCLPDSIEANGTLEDRETAFSRTNSCISFQAEKISLGIPKI